MTIKKYFNVELIIKFMHENNLNKKQFCKMCKITTLIFDKIMQNDITHFNFMNIIRIVKVLNIEIDMLINA